MTRPRRRKPSGRVRVAYLSAFFDGTNYMKPVWAALNHHDREAFELHLLVDSEAHAKDTLLPPAEHYDYLKYYDRIDIALDAFPYNGGTTTMEAIWQGVPVLTFNGDRWASRTSQTLLLRTHLAEFVQANERKMIREAVRIANDPNTPERLAGLRRDMRHQLRQSSACDGAASARALEDPYGAVLAARA